jgi:hypothetical protein
MADTKVRWRLRPWQTILLFGILLCAIYGFGSFTFDYYAGAATAGFGVMGEVGGVGMFFIYVMGYFIALVVVLPILLVRRFGVGLMVFLPYAIGGLFVEYYMEWVLVRSLVTPWAVAGWSTVGLAVGFSADLAYRFLPACLNERPRTIITGAILGIVNFLLVLVALTFFYTERQAGSGSFLGVAYYALPFLLVSSGFGGYTAYAISRETG